MFEDIAREVKLLMNFDNDGHGFDHVKRVCKTAVKLAEKENAKIEIVKLAALLHDADDYKLFGAENAEKLTNACKIMAKYNIVEDTQREVCQIIKSMGYSKALKGIRPQSLEGKIVSDADMLDAIGANSVVRTLAYTLTKGSKIIFDAEIFPDSDLSSENYTQKQRSRDGFINHFFDKLLRLRGMLFTQSAKEEAVRRHEFMLEFLKQFFIENDVPQWLDYLDWYEKKLEKAA